jgi:predicted nucleic acid-binding protein
MTPTLDTNILVYSVDGRDPRRQAVAQLVTDAVRASRGPVALQVCGEFYHATTRRLRQPTWMAAQAARNFMTAFPVFAATVASTELALAEAAAGRLSFWDANLLWSAEHAGCTHVVSEDMADGFRAGRIEVVNPFGGDGPSQRIRELLSL